MVVPVLAARWIPRRCPMHPREDPHLRYPDHCGFQRHSDRPFSTCETPGPRSFHRSPTALRHGRAFPFRPRPSRRSEPAISALYPAVRRSRSNRLPFWSQRCCLLACTIPARCLPCQAWQPDRTNHSITTFYVFSCKSGIAQHGRRDRISGFTPSCPANPHSCMARKTSLLPLSVAPGPHPGHPFIDSLSGSLLIGVESGGIVLIVPRRIRVHPDPGSNNVDAGIAAPYSRPWPPDETGDAPRRSAEQGWSARCFPRSHPRGGGQTGISGFRLFPDPPAYRPRPRSVASTTRTGTLFLLIEAERDTLRVRQTESGEYTARIRPCDTSGHPGIWGTEPHRFSQNFPGRTARSAAGQGADPADRSAAAFDR